MANTKYEELVASCYSTWDQSYHEDYYGPQAPYPPVHVDLLKNLITEAGVKTLLDAGCGPASFLRQITNQDIDLYGFDLTPEMVTEAQRVLKFIGVPSHHIWQGSVVLAESFVIPGSEAGKQFDAAICIGVLPHIPPLDEVKVITNLHDSVKKGGMVVLQARNQLFSLFTQNRYTYEFFIQELIRVEHLTKKLEDSVSKNLSQALEELKTTFRMDLPPIRRGKAGEPGYDEILSRTHNPLLLKEQFVEAGFKEVKLLFYHYHCLPPMFQALLGEHFHQESLNMENPTDWRGYFMASTFLIAGKRI